MRYVTAGESHGPELIAIVEGAPAGLRISEASINADLARRQAGYGRSDRQAIEHDVVRVLSGVRFGRTIGSPITLAIENKDWVNWQNYMAPFGEAPLDVHREVTPRPGHADLVGVLKIDSDDCRDVFERASARETAARVAAAAVAREFLADIGVEIFSYVVSVGNVTLSEEDLIHAADHTPMAIEMSDMRCPDEAITLQMKAAVDKAREQKTSLGGTFRIVVTGLIPGLGGYATADERLTGQLGGALFSIPAVRGVEFGMGFKAAAATGSQVHDPIDLKVGSGFIRSSNNAGGLEGGMTTGMPLIITCAMKPIPTLANPLPTVNLDTLEKTYAAQERSDVCAVPACAVVGEAHVAFVLANAYLEKFGHDNMSDIRSSLKAFEQRLKTMSR